MNPDNRWWILELAFDAIESSVRIVLTSDPDHGTRDREIVIRQVTRFHVERYHDADEITLGDFRGRRISRVGKHWRYVLNTGDAEVKFDALEKVVL